MNSSTCMFTYVNTCMDAYTYMYMYMKIHVPSMLAIDKHTQQTNKQPQWLHLTLEQPLWLRKIISHNGLEK